jgi:hypothetical protein
VDHGLSLDKRRGFMTVSRYYVFLEKMAERLGVHTEEIEQKINFDFDFDNEGQAVIYTGLIDPNEIQEQDQENHASNCVFWELGSCNCGKAERK